MSDNEWWAMAIGGFTVGVALYMGIRALIRGWLEDRKCQKRLDELESVWRMRRHGTVRQLEEHGYDRDEIARLLQKRRQHGRRDDQRK